jgi:hypothetical protein
MWAMGTSNISEWCAVLLACRRLPLRWPPDSATSILDMSFQTKINLLEGDVSELPSWTSSIALVVSSVPTCDLRASWIVATGDAWKWETLLRPPGPRRRRAHEGSASVDACRLQRGRSCEGSGAGDRFVDYSFRRAVVDICLRLFIKVHLSPSQDKALPWSSDCDRISLYTTSSPALPHLMVVFSVLFNPCAGRARLHWHSVPPCRTSTVSMGCQGTASAVGKASPTEQW